MPWIGMGSSLNSVAPKALRKCHLSKKSALGKRRSHVDTWEEIIPGRGE